MSLKKSLDIVVVFSDVDTRFGAFLMLTLCDTALCLLTSSPVSQVIAKRVDAWLR